MIRPLERILVVDDDQYIQEIIAAALEDYGGYTVAGCISGAHAIACEFDRLAATHSDLEDRAAKALE